MSEDRRDEVVAAIRSSLPGFFERNGMDDVSESVMDNLAHHVARTVPARVYRPGCFVEFRPDSACACMGLCMAWETVDDLRASSPPSGEVR